MVQARQLDRAFGYLDLSGGFRPGTLRNAIMDLRRQGKVLKFPKENPARFILASWRNRSEYERWFRNDKNPTGVEVVVFGSGVDFGCLVGSLDWGELVCVHDVRVEFDCGCFGGDGFEAGWRRVGRSCSWVRRFVDLEFPLTVQLYGSGHVQVSVRCSLNPIPFDFEGLTRLASVLGELKGRLGWSGVPNVADWVVTQWHYGKDCVQEVSGPAFNVTFKAWSENLGRIYFKSSLKRVRVEEIQAPHQTIQGIFDSVMNRDEKTK